LAGVPTRVLRAFSRRRAEIEAALTTRGESSARAAEVAALDTRQAKTHTVDPSALRADWAARADALGFDASRLDALVGRPRELDRLMGRSRLGEALTEHASVFDRRHVIRTLCDNATRGADLAAVETAADRFLAAPGVVRLADAPVIGATYSTKELMDIERDGLAYVARHRNDGIAATNRPSSRRSRRAERRSTSWSAPRAPARRSRSTRPAPRGRHPATA
jgi:hypothetical protein